MFKEFVHIVIAIVIGNLVLRIGESLVVNIWLARVFACIVVGLYASLSYHCEMLKRKKNFC